MVIHMSKARRSASKRIRFPRRLWLIKPFDRIRESKRIYNRQRLNREMRRELAELASEEEGEGHAHVE
jgi:hypothetical protein